MATTATSTEWSRIVNTTTRKFVKGFEDTVMRERKLLAKVKKNGGVISNVAGDGVQWQVKKRRRAMQVNNGAQSRTFAPENLHDKCFLDYAGYTMTEATTEREKLKNRSVQALIDVWGTATESLLEDMTDGFSECLYIDDSAAGNSGNVAGLEAMFAATQTISEGTTTSTVARTANAADRLYYPNDTYAGVSTVLGNSGGSWNANWPVGKGDAEFDYFSPLIVNGGSSAYDGTTTTWTGNCRSSVQYGLIRSRKNASSTGRVDLCLFDATLYDKLRTKSHAIEQFMVNKAGKGDLSMGIEGDSFWLEGAECTWEYGIPANVGYGINTKCVEIHSMYGDLFEVKGPYEDEDANAWKMAINFIGQLKFKSPRNFIKWQLGTGTIS